MKMRICLAKKRKTKGKNIAAHIGNYANSVTTPTKVFEKLESYCFLRQKKFPNVKMYMKTTCKFMIDLQFAAKL